MKYDISPLTAGFDEEWPEWFSDAVKRRPAIRAPVYIIPDAVLKLTSSRVHIYHEFLVYP